ncbi:MAG: M48 family metalloprotease [Bdellovibrionota bacterium]|jgi:Zn-dependent protease with chaperone function
MDYFDPVMAPLSWIVALLICGSTLYKIFQLSKGENVAKLLGGVLIPTDTQEPKFKMILNVVEEISVVSGIKPLPVYYLPEEKGINTFSAGSSTENGVITVTQGCIDNLSRDELQGVIAHEFCHIFNGDMRLNVLLIGLIYGLSLPMSMGKGIFEFLKNFNKRINKKENIVITLIIIGITGGILGSTLALFFCGAMSYFCSMQAKASVTRHKEFLADATAVQYTRNPEGIGGALRKIMVLPEGSEIKSPHVKEINHMLFANYSNDPHKGDRDLATHPPLEERIKRIFEVEY